MNLILLFPEDYIADQRVVLKDRRLDHIATVHRAEPGDRLRVGLLNGLMGYGDVVALEKDHIELELSLSQEPPAPLSLTLILALPRPKMLKRVLQCIASLGVKQIYLINSYRVDKSYWGSPLLEEDKLQEQLILGLEQACDTRLPDIHLRKRFKPFVEDELPQLAANTRALVAHPVASQDCPAATNTPTTLVIGPEGGFIPYEVDKLAECGFTPISLGQRILRVETAVPVLISRLSP